jgi:hypothetical protein
MSSVALHVLESHITEKQPHATQGHPNKTDGNPHNSEQQNP